MFDDGDRQAVVQWHATGTFTGAPFLGIEPTGRRIEIHGLDVIRFDANHKIETNTVYYDGAQFARDIGMLPPRDSALDRAMLGGVQRRHEAEEALAAAEQLPGLDSNQQPFD